MNNAINREFDNIIARFCILMVRCPFNRRSACARQHIGRSTVTPINGNSAIGTHTQHGGCSALSQSNPNVGITVIEPLATTTPTNPLDLRHHLVKGQFFGFASLCSDGIGNSS